MRKEEITILKCLEGKLNESTENGFVREFEYFINGFIAATTIIGLEMKTLPSKEFMTKLEKIAKEASETMDII